MKQAGAKYGLSHISIGPTLGLGIFCVLRASYVILVLRWTNSWTGIWTIMSIHHILFSAIAVVLGFMVFLMTRKTELVRIKRIFVATRLIAEYALAAVFICWALLTFSTYLIPKRMLAEIGFTGMMWIGAAFGISLANYIFLIICLFMLDSRFIGRRLGLEKGREHSLSEENLQS